MWVTCAFFGATGGVAAAEVIATVVPVAASVVDIKTPMRITRNAIMGVSSRRRAGKLFGDAARVARGGWRLLALRREPDVLDVRNLQHVAVRIGDQGPVAERLARIGWSESKPLFAA